MKNLSRSFAGPLLLFLLGASHALGQQLPIVTQYREYQAYFNPASVSLNYFSQAFSLNTGVSYRSQWQKIEGAPRATLAYAEWISRRKGAVHLALGGHIVQYRTDPISFHGASFRLNGILSNDPFRRGLAVGLSIGEVRYRIRIHDIRLRQPFDPLQAEIQPNQRFLDVSLGVFAYHRFERGLLDGDVLYAGLSIPQTQSFLLDQKDPQGNFYIQRQPHWFFTAGWYKFFNESDFVEPSIWWKYTPGSLVHMDVNIRAQWRNLLWAGTGISFFQLRSLHFETGFLMSDWVDWSGQLRIGYGYTVPLGLYRSVFGSSHELNVSLSLNPRKTAFRL